MISVRRTTTTALVAAALALAPATTATAEPGPGHGGDRGQLRQLLRDVERLDSRLERVAGSKSMTRLADDHEAALVANVEADRAELAALAGEAQADPAYDTRAARRELRGLRVQNYPLAISIVRGVERATEEAAALPEAAAELALALEGALAVDDETAKEAVKAARDHLVAALELLDDSDEETEDETETEPEELG